jgi:hypothetical protein
VRKAVQRSLSAGLPQYARNNRNALRPQDVKILASLLNRKNMHRFA